MSLCLFEIHRIQHKYDCRLCIHNKEALTCVRVHGPRSACNVSGACCVHGAWRIERMRLMWVIVFTVVVANSFRRPSIHPGGHKTRRGCIFSFTQICWGEGDWHEYTPWAGEQWPQSQRGDQYVPLITVQAAEVWAVMEPMLSSASCAKFLRNITNICFRVCIIAMCPSTVFWWTPSLGIGKHRLGDWDDPLFAHQIQ